MRKGMLTWAAGLGFVAVIVGLGWLIAISQADRWWGLVAMVIGAVMMVVAWRAGRSGSSGA